MKTQRNQCKIHGCKNEAVSKGYCRHHYQKQYRNRLYTDGYKHLRRIDIIRERIALQRELDEYNIGG